MTKQIIFIFALLCTLQAQASVQPVQKDTVRHTIHYEVAELLQPMQPVYLNGVLLPASRTGNWFVSISGGATVFLGTPLGCEDLFGRVKPSYSLAVGKWFTPLVGARVNYSGLQFKDAQLSTQDYHYIHADLLWNLLGRRYARQEQVRWRLAPFMGVGLLHNATNGNNPFALSYGILTQYRISKRVSAMLELSNVAKTIDIELQKQLDKPQAWFCKYFPARIRNVSEREIADRKLVFDFKDGRAYEEVAQRTAANMTERYGTSCTNIIFSPVPASTDKKNEIRYKAFCQRVCELTGAINGYDHVSVSGERLTIHENRKAEKEVRKVNVIEFDSAFFNGRSVVVFDDVITKGLSYATYANQLESLGANVLGGIFLARTHYKVK